MIHIAAIYGVAKTVLRVVFETASQLIRRADAHLGYATFCQYCYDQDYILGN